MRFHRDAYSAVGAVVILAALVAILLLVVNPIR